MRRASSSRLAGLALAGLADGGAGRRLRRQGNAAAADEQAVALARRRAKSTANRTTAFLVARRGKPAGSYFATVDEMLARYLTYRLSDSWQSTQLTVLAWYETWLAVTEQERMEHGYDGAHAYGSATAILDMTDRDREYHLALFVMFLARLPATQERMIKRGCLYIQPKTVGSYLSALTRVYRDAFHVNIRDKCGYLSELLHSLDIKDSNPNPRLHVPVATLVGIVQRLRERDDRHGRLMAFMIILAFLLALRVGEYTKTTGKLGPLDAKADLRYEDITLELVGRKGTLTGLPPAELRRLLRQHAILRISFVIGESKTAKGGDSAHQLTVWSAPDSPACLCSIARRFFLEDIKAGIDPRGKALFADEAGEAVTDDFMRYELREVFRRQRVRDENGKPYDRDLIIPHVARAEGTTAMAAAGAHRLILNVFGRWRHESQLTYLRFVPDMFFGLASAMLAGKQWRPLARAGGDRRAST